MRTTTIGMLLLGSVIAGCTSDPTAPSSAQATDSPANVARPLTTSPNESWAVSVGSWVYTTTGSIVDGGCNPRQQLHTVVTPQWWDSLPPWDVSMQMMVPTFATCDGIRTSGGILTAHAGGQDLFGMMSANTSDFALIGGYGAIPIFVTATPDYGCQFIRWFHVGTNPWDPSSITASTSPTFTFVPEPGTSDIYYAEIMCTPEAPNP